MDDNKIKVYNKRNHLGPVDPNNEMERLLLFAPKAHRSGVAIGQQAEATGGKSSSYGALDGSSDLSQFAPISTNPTEWSEDIPLGDEQEDVSVVSSRESTPPPRAPDTNSAAPPGRAAPTSHDIPILFHPGVGIAASVAAPWMPGTLGSVLSNAGVIWNAVNINQVNRKVDGLKVDIGGIKEHLGRIEKTSNEHLVTSNKRLFRVELFVLHDQLHTQIGDAKKERIRLKKQLQVLLDKPIDSQDSQVTDLEGLEELIKHVSENITFNEARKKAIQDDLKKMD
jgi:hypothetical protein